MTAPFRNSPMVQHPNLRRTMASVGASCTARPRDLIQETPVALVFNGTTAAVMMASPDNVQEFALGFALTEGFVSRVEDIEEFEQVAHQTGIEARFWLKGSASDKLAARQRAMLGPVGCGLCGIDSLEQALRSVARVTNRTFRIGIDDIVRAVNMLGARQPLHDRTRSAHAAGFLVPGQGVVIAREDVGRHNALDKLLGALILAGLDPRSGAVIMTSRISVELVQKTAALACPVLIAASSPTVTAVDLAKTAGLTLITNAKTQEYCVFSHGFRVTDRVRL
ncbi:MAG: formate dehydrogenase accessory sulfurtransferase FdhD [Pseudomonadota bacterium]